MLASAIPLNPTQLNSTPRSCQRCKCINFCHTFRTSSTSALSWHPNRWL